jgi:hypothetical protein
MLSASHPLRITLTLFTSFSHPSLAAKKITFTKKLLFRNFRAVRAYKSNAPLPLARQINNCNIWIKAQKTLFLAVTAK